MAFKIFKNTDAGAPALSGLTGSLLSVLNYCLVTGSGWLKPYEDSGTGNTASIGCFQQPTGSQMGLVVNDSGPGAGGGVEARLTGYLWLTANNTGSYPFPTPAQGVGSLPMIVARKSAAATAVSRTWYVAADSRSMYGFVATGDTAGTYLTFAFGDIYSIMTGSFDRGACLIAGRTAENNSTITNDGLDKLTNALTTGVAGNWLALSFGGQGCIGGQTTSYPSPSIAIGKHGDAIKGSASGLLGNLPYPNTADGGLYLSPVWVSEVTGMIRGRMRGFWQACHPIAGFTDSSSFTAGTQSGSIQGRSFFLLKQSGQSGVYVIETSDTLETN